MGNDKVDIAKTNILLSIHDLTTITKNRGDNRSAAKLTAQAHILEGLDQRIERSQLPDGFVRSVINDVRLEVLIILADMKFVLTLEKQELIAPTSKLRQEAHNRLVEIRGEGGVEFDNEDPARRTKHSVVENDLKGLSSVEHLLHENLL